MLKGKSQRNIIHVIHDSNGQRYDRDQVATQFVNYFRNFLGANFPVSPISEYEDAFTTELSSNEASKMVKPITDSEIKKAMFNIGDNKAPGPDDYSAKFFKEAWHIVGTDVCNVVKEFFSSGKLLGELNTTIISLIPKISNPLLVTDFRSIACYNVVYKCISKVITERIKGCLNKLINKNQSAFIPGRLIQDNILLAQDLMHGYNRSGGLKRVAFKIDIQKAYDTVSWDFMENLLKLFELRQGDPMSPYLFTMVMEFFTLVMEKNVRNTLEFNYHFGCKSLKITYICFADDLMIFCHGDPCSVKVIKKSIEDFGNLPMKYLGVPLISKRLGVKDCKSLIDKVNAKYEYLKTLRSMLQTKIDCLIDAHSWKDIVGILADKPCLNNIWSIIRRLSFGAAIYFIWQEGNFRTFRSQKRDWTVVMQLIFDSVKTRLMGLEVKKSTTVDNAAAI
ncbi:RNA-directed DNA polymerase, eukaryota, reverse transcriptase zinc-binding domain protein [Tanacetum coccineum]